ncbi:MAG: transcriptional regulator NrdR [Candidatus Muirbacterium halophilum]|nr:transcriptional regulator NrdR [Candidatus Muirbacterium halophilum]MCK9474887.1 transcriptional regulator NrdR [Candidatus Muirbacterium halophilum]
MKCPFCEGLNTKVLDSRETDEGNTTRRRRECQSCQKRFTTYERVEEFSLRVIKNNGEREDFDRNKILKGIMFSCQKRIVATKQIEDMVTEIENEIIATGKKEVETSIIGSLVMQKLKVIDEVAYIRFASVYKRFKCIDEFREEIASF